MPLSQQDGEKHKARKLGPISTHTEECTYPPPPSGAAGASAGAAGGKFNRVIFEKQDKYQKIYKM